MNISTPQPKQNKTFFSKLKGSSSSKLIVIAILCLVMLIPLKLIQNLINERKSRKFKVEQKINQKWGREVHIGTPVLQVPYCFNETYSVGGKNTYTKNCNQYIYIFPEQCTIASNADVQIKKYGIYNSSVFSSSHQMKGEFLSVKQWNKTLKGKELQWEKAKMVMSIPNLKGVKSSLTIKVNENAFPFRNTSQNGYEDNIGGHVRNANLETQLINLNEADGAISFDMDLETNGSMSINYIPLAQETSVSINSNWDTPSYSGAFLPAIAEGSKNQNAKWKVMSFNSTVPSFILNSLPLFNDQSFGVNFIEPVNDYLKTERTAKYGLLVISLTFLAFFLIQMTSGMSIHSFQYLLIGLALALFYVMLLSFSEHIGFNKAYLSAGSMVIILITLFSKSLFEKWKLPGFIFTTLAVLYSFLFIIMHLETYSLVVGSIGLFIILSVVMYFSRKINWKN